MDNNNMPDERKFSTEKLDDAMKELIDICQQYNDKISQQKQQQQQQPQNQHILKSSTPDADIIDPRRSNNNNNNPITMNGNREFPRLNRLFESKTDRKQTATMATHCDRVTTANEKIIDELDGLTTKTDVEPRTATQDASIDRLQQKQCDLQRQLDELLEVARDLDLKQKRKLGEDDLELIEFRQIENELRVSELNRQLSNIQEQLRLRLFRRLSQQHHQQQQQQPDETTPSTSSCSDEPTASSERINDLERIEEGEEDDNEYYCSSEEFRKVYETKISPIIHAAEAATPPPRIVPTSYNHVNSAKRGGNRPLTMYLPKPDEEIDLIETVQSLGHDLNILSADLQFTPCTARGYLYKSCSNNSKKWLKRFFYFDRQVKELCYYENEERTGSPKRCIPFDEIGDVYVDHRLNELNEKQKGSRRKSYVFVLATTKRKYLLASSKPEAMRAWIDVLFTAAKANDYFQQDFSLDNNPEGGEESLSFSYNSFAGE